MLVSSAVSLKLHVFGGFGVRATSDDDSPGISALPPALTRCVAAHQINITLLLFQSKRIKFSSKSSSSSQTNKNRFEIIFNLYLHSGDDGTTEEERERERKMEKVLLISTAFKLNLFSACCDQSKLILKFQWSISGHIQSEHFPFCHHLHSIKPIFRLRRLTAKISDAKLCAFRSHHCSHLTVAGKYETSANASWSAYTRRLTTHETWRTIYEVHFRTGFKLKIDDSIDCCCVHQGMNRLKYQLMNGAINYKCQTFLL